MQSRRRITNITGQGHGALKRFWTLPFPPNYRPAQDAAVAFYLHSGRHWRRASEAGCSAAPHITPNHKCIQLL